MRVEFFGVLVLVFCMSFGSAGFFDDVFGSITGNVVADVDGVEYDVACDDAKVVFEESYIGYEIPGGIPFSDDVFNFYIDDEFFVSFVLEDKKIASVGCEVSEDASYNVYASEELIEDLSGYDSGEGVVDFYNKKRASGDLDIVAVGFGKKLKLGFINFGLKIAGW